jgi:hypothetical protein
MTVLLFLLKQSFNLVLVPHNLLLINLLQALKPQKGIKIRFKATKRYQKQSKSHKKVLILPQKGISAISGCIRC